MKTINKNALCEILDLEKDNEYRLYCDGISKDREADILTKIKVSYQVKSTIEQTGNLKMDFNKEDYFKVLDYFVFKK